MSGGADTVWEARLADLTQPRWVTYRDLAADEGQSREALAGALHSASLDLAALVVRLEQQEKTLRETREALRDYLDHTDSASRRGHTNTSCPPLTRAMCKPYMRARAVLEGAVTAREHGDLYVYWCPICKRQTERAWHTVKGAPLFPQTDDDHKCERIDVVPLADAVRAEEERDYLRERFDGHQRVIHEQQVTLIEVIGRVKTNVARAWRFRERAVRAEEQRDTLREAVRELLADDDMPNHWDDCVCSYCVRHRSVAAALSSSSAPGEGDK